MRTKFIAAALFLATPTLASAADLAVKAPAPVVAQAAWNWSGFYIGLQAGAGWGTTESTLNSISVPGAGSISGLALPIAQNSRSGFLGGGQIGYDIQSGWAVFGVQGDIAGLDIQGTAPCIIELSCTASSHWLATATGRIGAVVAERTLVYLKGGAAWLNTTHSVSTSAFGALGALGGPSGLGLSSADSNAVGWLIGFGAEFAFAPNWSAFIEYDYMDFSNTSIALNLTEIGVPTVATANVNIQNKLSVAKIGVNYKFGGPVLARY